MPEKQQISGEMSRSAYVQPKRLNGVRNLRRINRGSNADNDHDHDDAGAWCDANADRSETPWKGAMIAWNMGHFTSFFLLGPFVRLDLAGLPDELMARNRYLAGLEAVGAAYRGVKSEERGAR